MVQEADAHGKAMAKPASGNASATARPALSVQAFHDVQLKDAVILAAFPTTGSASSIAAQYLCRALNLPLVAHIPVPELSSVMAIQGGLATAAIRIHGGEVECKLGTKCPRVYIVTTELAMPAPVAQKVADALLDWAKEGRAHMLLAMEAVVRAELDTTPDVFAASAQSAVLKELVKTGTPVMERAIIGGVTAHLVLAGVAKGVRTGSLLVEANRSHPDGRAAAALIEAVARFLPDVPIDHKPLMSEATKLEEEIRSSIAAAEHTVPGADPASFI